LPVSRCRWTATLPSPCHRLNRGGDRDANQALWRITLVRMAHDPRTRDYVARRTAEGKTKREIIRCLKRYIARETTSENGRDVELWLPADRDAAVYITIDGVVEVWPLNEPPLGCD
jgi:hypothetical protein